MTPVMKGGGRIRSLTSVQSPASPSLWRLVAVLLLVLVGMVSLGAVSTVRGAAVASGVVVTGGLLGVWRQDRGLCGASFLYLATFSCFHFGLVWTLPILGQEALVGGGGNGWIFDPRVGSTVLVTCWGVVAVLFGALLGHVADGRLVRRSKETTEASIRASAVVGLAVGWPLFFSFIWSAGGPAILLGGYGEFFSASSDGRFGYASLLLGIGSALCVAVGGPWARAGWLSWGMFAIAMLAVGSRGSALYPLAVMLFAQGWGGRRLRLRSLLVAAAAVLSLLTLISAIRVSRRKGVASLGDALSDASPLQAVAELGYTLYPVLQVHGWVAQGEPLRGGDTVIVLPIRLFEQIMGIPQPIPTADDRFFNILVERRLGPVGGSPIAEGYINGGLAGVLLIMGLIGLVLGILDARPKLPANTAVAIVILLPLLMNIRNFFSALPVYWFVGFALLYFGRLLVAKRSMSTKLPISRLRSRRTNT